MIVSTNHRIHFCVHIHVLTTTIANVAKFIMLFITGIFLEQLFRFPDLINSPLFDLCTPSMVPLRASLVYVANSLWEYYSVF